MFPPQKKPPMGPPMGPPGMPPGMDPFAPPPGVPPMGVGPDPFAPPIGGISAKPGQGMDPMAAMMGGLGPDPSMTAGASPAQGPPMGPDGLPVGGSLPMMDSDGGGDMGGSSLLKALAGSLGGGSDPYGQPPGAPDRMFQGVGTGDPGMGLQQLLQMLALGQAGVGGSSDLDPGGGQIGGALGF